MVYPWRPWAKEPVDLEENEANDCVLEPPTVVQHSTMRSSTSSATLSFPALEDPTQSLDFVSPEEFKESSYLKVPLRGENQIVNFFQEARNQLSSQNQANLEQTGECNSLFKPLSSGERQVSNTFAVQFRPCVQNSSPEAEENHSFYESGGKCGALLYHPVPLRQGGLQSSTCLENLRKSYTPFESVEALDSQPKDRFSSGMFRPWLQAPSRSENEEGRNLCEAGCSKGSEGGSIQPIPEEQVGPRDPSTSKQSDGSHNMFGSEGIKDNETACICTLPTREEDSSQIPASSKEMDEVHNLFGLRSTPDSGLACIHPQEQSDSQSSLEQPAEHHNFFETAGFQECEEAFLYPGPKERFRTEDSATLEQDDPNLFETFNLEIDAAPDPAHQEESSFQHPLNLNENESQFLFESIGFGESETSFLQLIEDQPGSQDANPTQDEAHENFVQQVRVGQIEVDFVHSVTEYRTGSEALTSLIQGCQQVNLSPDLNYQSFFPDLTGPEKSTAVYSSVESPETAEDQNLSLNPVPESSQSSSKDGSSTKETSVLVDNQVYNCTKCSATFKRRVSFNRHVVTHNRGVNFPCSNCSAEFSSDTQLKMHMANHFKCPFSCVSCDAKFRLKSSYNKHLSEHSRKELFSCRHCSKTFTKKRNLQNHVATHSAARPFSCNKCPAKFKLKSYLKAHGSVHSNERLFACHHCSVTFKKKVYLKNHIVLKHLTEKRHSCHLCTRDFASVSNLKFHLQTHSNERPYSCHHCCANFKVKENLKRHIISKHLREKFYECNLCSKNFSSVIKLKVHMLTHTNEKPYSCHLCCLHYKYKNNLKNHIVSQHMKEVHHKCNLCFKEFSSESIRQRHMLTHSKVKPFSCHHCSANFKEKCNLRKHIISKHLREKVHMCNVCSKSFTLKSYLQHHLLTHSYEKPYACEHCWATFKAKFTLKSHIISKHLREKYHCCRVCTANFATCGQLRNHMITHSNEKLFSCHVCSPFLGSGKTLRAHIKSKHSQIEKRHPCTFCPATFTYECELRTHMVKHSNEKPFTCHECSARFKLKQYLKKHVTAKHTKL